MACKVIESSGEADLQYCAGSSQNSKNRCYAVVEYSDGRKQKIKSKDCVSSLADCWKNGRLAMKPDCANIEDVP